jgi:hypothetical protein
MALTETFDADELAQLRDLLETATAGRIKVQVGAGEYRRRLTAAVEAVAAIMHEPHLDEHATASEHRDTLHRWAAAISTAPVLDPAAGAGCCGDDHSHEPAPAPRGTGVNRRELVNQRPVYRVGPDAYLAWSHSSEAPVDTVMTLLDVWRAGISSERLARLLTLGHTLTGEGPRTPQELVTANQAGPRQTSLTLDAILRAYASDDALRTFEATPADIEPVTIGETGSDAVFWTPWRPGEAPETLDGADLNAWVPLLPGSD